MYVLFFAKPIAGVSFSKLPRRAQRAFDATFDRLSRDPRTPARGLDVHQLWGYQNVWTLRIPPWRGVYAIDGSSVVMIIFGHRATVYAQLHALLPPEGRYISEPRIDRRRGR